MGVAREGTVLWEPPAAFKDGSTLARYMAWLEENRGLSFADYDSLWRWSVDDLAGFWGSLWDYSDIQATTPYREVLGGRAMPGAEWFAGAELNYAAHAFRHMRPDQPALLCASETRPLREVSWAELHDAVAAVAAGLTGLGVRKGDRVVAYMPNIPETLIAFLACASIGAVWSSCSPDFGSPAVIDRFAQIEPTVLLAVDGYTYNGKAHDRLDVVARLQGALPSVERTVLVPYLTENPRTDGLTNVVSWSQLLADGAGAELTFTPVPFDHPLWVLYSSGTTGLPKAIVQGHGGIVLEHHKAIGLQMNITADDRSFWYTTTGWMMWNMVIGGLLVGATVALYDGSVAYPNLNRMWEFAAEAQLTSFGTSAGFIATCMNNDVRPGATVDLSRLKKIGATGSPLSPEGFTWVYEQVKRDVWLASSSGGTDVCSAFVGGCALLPVTAGEIQCRCLGVAATAYDAAGRPVVGEVGELVITEPLPSMPLYFWDDPGDRRYRESYFELYPGVWRHGDWIKFTEGGACVIYGRSDSTINRLGVRMGTSDIYRVVEDIPEVLDSLVVDLEALGRASFMPLFVVLRADAALDDALKGRIRARIRGDVSPRHVPDEIYAIAEVPRTLSGKKLEVPVRRILLGVPVEQAASIDSMTNPGSIAYFVALAEALNPAIVARA
jgi:acetoacetyl-CoA synthetase